VTGDLAAHLARIRTQHPAWRIYWIDRPDGAVWAAYRGEPGDPDEETVSAETLPQLECELAGR
jgi:hypothetical protein